MSIEDQAMSLEIVRKGDNFTASEVACRLKISTKDAKILLDGLEQEKLLVKEVHKNNMVYRLRSMPFINTIRLANWSPKNETFRGWL